MGHLESSDYQNQSGGHTVDNSQGSHQTSQDAQKSPSQCNYPDQDVSNAGVRKAWPTFGEMCGADFSGTQSCTTAANSKITEEILNTSKGTKKRKTEQHPRQLIVLANGKCKYISAKMLASERSHPTKEKNITKELSGKNTAERKNNGRAGLVLRG